jgi:hypothetical protein
MLGNWDSMSIRERVDELRQSKADHAQFQQLAQGVDRLSLEIMACLAILGAMAERSAPEPSRVRAWCAALRNAAPRISQLDLETSAKRIFQLLEPVMNKPQA